MGQSTMVYYSGTSQAGLPELFIWHNIKTTIFQQNFHVSIITLSSKYQGCQHFLQLLCVRVYNMNTQENRYFQLPSACFVLFQYLKPYGKPGDAIAFQRQCISSEVQNHRHSKWKRAQDQRHTSSSKDINHSSQNLWIKKPTLICFCSSTS